MTVARLGFGYGDMYGICRILEQNPMNLYEFLHISSQIPPESRTQTPTLGCGARRKAPHRGPAREAGFSGTLCIVQAWKWAGAVVGPKAHTGRKAWSGLGAQEARKARTAPRGSCPRETPSPRDPKGIEGGGSPLGSQSSQRSQAHWTAWSRRGLQSDWNSPSLSGNTTPGSCRSLLGGRSHLSFPSCLSPPSPVG